MTFWGSCSINMALLTELSQSLTPLKSAKNRFGRNGVKNVSFRPLTPPLFTEEATESWPDRIMNRNQAEPTR